MRHKKIFFKTITIFILLTLVINSIIFINYNNISIKADKNDSQLRVIIEFDTPKINEIFVEDYQFSIVTIKDCFLHGEIGNPSLPIYPARILIPPEKEVMDITLDVVESFEMSGDFINKPILPQQQSYQISLDNLNDSLKINESIYNKDNYLNENLFQECGFGYNRGYKILTINLFPLNYNPKKGILEFYSQISITLNLEDISNIKTSFENDYVFLRDNQDDKKTISKFVCNPETINDYSEFLSEKKSNNRDDEDILLENYLGGLCENSQTIKYVIITSESLAETTGYTYNWLNLIEHRASYSGLSFRF